MFLTSPVAPMKTLLPVIHASLDRILWFATPAKAAAMVRSGQAVNVPGFTLGGIRLTEVPTGPRSRTHTGRSPRMGAIGRSQRYTTNDHLGRVNGFKFIDPVDLPIFHAATLSCGKVTGET